MLQLNAVSFQILNSFISYVDFSLIYSDLKWSIGKLSDLINVFQIGRYVSEIERNLWLPLSGERYVICIEGGIFLAWVGNFMFKFFILIFQNFNLLQTSLIFMLEIDTTLKHQFTNFISI